MMKNTENITLFIDYSKIFVVRILHFRIVFEGRKQKLKYSLVYTFFFLKTLKNHNKT